jgi:hypothetical protein
MVDGETTHSMRQQIEEIDARMARVESALEENTKLTRDISDYLVTARTGTKIIKGVAALASAVAALWAAIIWIRDHM